MPNKNLKAPSPFVSWLTKPFLTARDHAFVLDTLSLLLTSNGDVSDAIRTTASYTKSNAIKKVLIEAARAVEFGSPFWQALQSTRLFHEQAIALIRIGEESGRLAEHLQLVVIQEQKQREFQSKVRSAAAYPIIVFAIAIILATGIALFILPRLADTFTSLKVELPLPTRLAISLGVFLKNYGSVAIPVFLFSAICLIYLIFVNPKTKIIGEHILFVIPGINGLIRDAEVGRFGYLLGGALQAGIPINDALGLLARSTTSVSYSRFYNQLRTDIEFGHSIGEAFVSVPKSQKLFPAAVNNVLSAAERSGRLPEALLEINRRFETSTDVATKNVITALEPILLIIVWAGVMFVALAVILPVYSLIGGIDRARQVQLIPPSSKNKTITKPSSTTKTQPIK